MIELTKEQLIERIALFEDSKVICEQLNILAEDDYSDGNLYWLKEAQESINGMFELLMDLKKQHLLDSDSADIIKTEATKATELTMSGIGLDKAAIFALHHAGIKSMGELIATPEAHMIQKLRSSGIKDGKKLITEIKDTLEIEGLSLGTVFYQPT